MNPTSEHELQDAVEHHSVATSVALHLLPGVLRGAFYFVVVETVLSKGFPSGMALMLSNMFVFIPFMVVFFAYQRRKSDGRPILHYRDPLPVKQYFIWVPVIFLSFLLIAAPLEPIADFLKTSLVFIPEPYHFDMGLRESTIASYSTSVLIWTWTIGFLFGVLIGPILEEVYFRGYLLPRIPDMKGWQPVFNSALFSIYHVWSPWLILTRTFGLLPFVYFVQKKRNIYIGMWAHCLLNGVEYVAGAVLIYQFTSAS